MKETLILILLILQFSCSTERPEESLNNYLKKINYVEEDWSEFKANNQSDSLKLYWSEFLSNDNWIAGQHSTPNKASLVDFSIKNMMIEPPNISRFLERSFSVDGKKIKEEPNKKANKKYGFARCKNNVPIIGIPTPGNINPFTLIFFRYHEYGHHILGHAPCNSSKRKLYAEDEYDADCVAINELKKTQEGREILLIVYGAFTEMSYGANKYYPDGDDRANNILEELECE